MTAARTVETIGARLEEIDVAQRIWIVPAGRMKANKEHKVPLSAPALAILAEMKKIEHSSFVFPGRRTGKTLSNQAMEMTLRRLKADMTTHGFRSSFRDWAADRSSFPSEVVEMALAHVIESKVEAAYRRGDLFEKRRKLMDALARYCTAPADTKVVSLHDPSPKVRVTTA